MRTWPLLVLVIVGIPQAEAGKRSSTARAEFQRQHPCPSTGKHRGACHGFVVDHITPLACGGPDAASNMQWQTAADGKAKDRVERIGCK